MDVANPRPWLDLERKEFEQDEIRLGVSLKCAATSATTTQVGTIRKFLELIDIIRTITSVGEFGWNWAIW